MEITEIVKKDVIVTWTADEFDNFLSLIKDAYDNCLTPGDRNCLNVIICSLEVHGKPSPKFDKSVLSYAKNSSYKKCFCGDPAWGANGCCGSSGCSNVPA